MKKFSFVAMLAIATLTGCASTNGDVVGTASNIGTTLFQTAVNQRCQSEITANQYYKLASVIMTDEQKTSVVEKACNCVSEKAPQSVTMTEMATAAIDSNQRAVIVGKAVSNTLQACVAEWVK